MTNGSVAGPARSQCPGPVRSERPPGKAEVGVLLCDVGDTASLAAMARQTRLVLNCVGPINFLKKEG